jgi:hypothetical protein
MKFSRFSGPVALLGTAALVATFMALPQTSAVESAAGAIESVPSLTTQDLETITSEVTGSDPHAHQPSDPSILPTGPIVSVNDPRLSPAQQNAASTLLVASRSTIASFPNAAALAAGGYVSAGDNSSGLQHWVNDAFTHDGLEVDPNRIESFVVNIASGRTAHSAADDPRLVL